ncbi:hypothetical protein [Polynucleobacter antarcticus]|uniref:Uncharacterized protein n=1 Tax=Polynucleobacter antarcticus TaxID=1743162 RepID=A0A6M9PMT2_9BURK|nr:hypothetical protein [Polynucleobacter antarcticus]QKM61691.1 hypothetical protein DCO16_00455 [Polynucleobacter antarcticus]
MPTRQISSHSFDDILSELGDDPAIPDPHGIRKSSSPPRPSKEANTASKPTLLSQGSFQFSGVPIAPVLTAVIGLVLASAAMFFLWNTNQSSSEIELSALRNQLSALQKEMQLAKAEWALDQEDLYLVIDELEVSIHSLKLVKPITATQSKSVAIPHEAELRRWQYLGLTRMHSGEQAFFHDGKTTVVVKKDAVAIGEWRLSQAQKEMAILAHPQGKSITLNSARSE